MELMCEINAGNDRATPFGIRIHLLLRKATAGLTFLSTVFKIVLLIVETICPNILDVQQTFLLLNQWFIFYLRILLYLYTLVLFYDSTMFKLFLIFCIYII